MTPSRPLRLAHRGDWRKAPENSLAAFRRALALPTCDGLEFDVRLSADGVPVISHDATLARLRGEPVRVADLTAEELSVRAVPTLADVLGVAPPPAFLDVELKEDVGRLVVPLVEVARGDPPVGVVVSSFSPDTISSVRSVRPAWTCWFNTETLGPGAIGLALELGCGGIAANWRSIDDRSTALARDAGLVVAAWPVDRRSTVRRLAALGVTAVCVDGAALEP